MEPDLDNQDVDTRRIGGLEKNHNRGSVNPRDTRRIGGLEIHSDAAGPAVRDTRRIGGLES